MVEPMLLHCPHCQGFSYTMTPGGQTVRCPHCHADIASIMVAEDDLIVWRQSYDHLTIQRQYWWQVWHRVGDICFIIIGIGGVLALLQVLREMTVSTEPYLNLLTSQSPERLFFWISIFTNLWWYARIEKLLQSRKTIRPLRRLRHLQMDAITDWVILERMVPKLAIDASRYLTLEAERLIFQTVRGAYRRKQSVLTAAHLLYHVINTNAGKSACYRLEINLSDILAGCERVIQHEQLHPTSRFAEALLQAYAEARHSKRPQIGVLELLIGCILADERLRDLFDEMGVTIKEMQHVIHWGNIVQDMFKREYRRRHLAQYKPKTTMNRAMTARPTKLLDSLSQDFTLKARYNHFLPTVGRDEEVAEAFRVLQEGHSSVLLIGEPGVGKSSILEGIAQLMTAEDVPGPLQDKRLVVTDPGSLIAGASNIGGLEGRMQSLINEIIQAGNIIWCIEDIHTLLGAGSTQSSIDIGKVLMNYISQGYIKVIGTSTTKEFTKFIQPQEAFTRRFQVVRTGELKPDDAILVCEGRAPYIEGKYKVFFTYQALADCVTLTERYIKDRHLPAKALDVMEEAAVLVHERAGGKQALVTKEHVAQIIAEKTNVAVTSITTSESEKLLNLESILHARVIGQDEAIGAIAKSLRRAREDVRDLTRPIASLLFLGPTGVGKTETAKAIAETYFGNEQHMIRFDMSEYQSVESLTKLIGASGQPGALTEAIRQTPFSIVLLDELEKAHKDILNVFLQVLEDGRLTDGSGYTADFTNAMVIATSNAATAEIQQRYLAKETPEQIRESILEGEILQQWFTPEFLNRFDHIAVFTPLDPDELLSIAELLLGHLGKQLVEKGIQLRWTPDAVAELVRKGYHPQYGARPLRRVIQDEVQDGLAQLFLQAKITRRDVVELQADGSLKIYKAEKI